VDFAVDDFESYGLKGYALDVVEHGWGMFSMHGSGSWRALLGRVTGLGYSLVVSADQ
jgi:hypothetical protein